MSCDLLARVVEEANLVDLFIVAVVQLDSRKFSIFSVPVTDCDLSNLVLAKFVLFQFVAPAVQIRLLAIL